MLVSGSGFGVDIVNSGAGNDIFVASNNGGIVLADVDPNQDRIDFSAIEGASFEDVQIIADDPNDNVDNLGFTTVSVGIAPNSMSVRTLAKPWMKTTSSSLATKTHSLADS